MTTIDSEIGGLETAILLALHAKERGKRRVKTSKVNKGWHKIETGMEIFCPTSPEYPKDMIGLEVGESNRLYTTDMNDIVVSPSRAIGRRLELGLLCSDGTFKWMLIKPMQVPRGLVPITNLPVSWYSLHFRKIREGEPESYVVKPMPLTETGVPLMKPLGWKGFEAQKERAEMEEQLAMSLSVFEDAMRSGSVLATVEEHNKLRFPVSADTYKSFFALRDGLKETPTGRRNPILHWCSKHIRQAGVRTVDVSGHERGKAEIRHGAMRLTLERSDGYTPFLPE